MLLMQAGGSGYQWSSQVIGIGRALAVRLTIALTTLALAPTYHEQDDERWPGTCPARPSLCYATGVYDQQDRGCKMIRAAASVVSLCNYSL